jgi:hypothetical protein
VASFATADKRFFPRLRPRGLASLAIYQGARIPPAYGILNDISQRGACVESDRILARGQRLQIRIQFATEPELFEAGAAVCWTRPLVIGGGRRAGVLTGIEFWPAEGPSPWLQRLLAAPDFAHPAGEYQPFDDLVRELEPYLDRLGDFLVPGSGKPGR